VELEYVVDKDGRVVGNTPHVVRATIQDMLAAVVALLPSFRYEPAKKSSVPVAQLVRYETGLQIAIAPLGSSQSTRRRSASPRC
jgi:hypothetical protein